MPNSPFLSLLHPPLQHGLDLLRALGCDVQLLKPTITREIRYTPLPNTSESLDKWIRRHIAKTNWLPNKGGYFFYRHLFLQSRSAITSSGHWQSAHAFLIFLVTLGVKRRGQRRLRSVTVGSNDTRVPRALCSRENWANERVGRKRVENAHFRACWRHRAQACQCPGSKELVNFESAPFGFLIHSPYFRFSSSHNGKLSLSLQLYPNYRDLASSSVRTLKDGFGGVWEWVRVLTLVRDEKFWILIGKWWNLHLRKCRNIYYN